MTQRLFLQRVEAPGLSDPLAALRTAAKREGDYAMLHSAETDGRASTSIIGFDPLMTVDVDASGQARLEGVPLGLVGIEAMSPLEALERVVSAVHWDAPHPLLGWLGFVSYDIGRFLERIPTVAEEKLRWPSLRFSLYRNYLLFTPEDGIQAFALSEDGKPAFPELPAVPIASNGGSATLSFSQPRQAFEVKVRQVKEYIAAGDIYQANLAQRWTFRTDVSPELAFERLCRISPAMFAACMRFGKGKEVRHVVSASPELFLSAGQGHLVTRPIKGTRPRDLADPQHDAELRQALLDSAKDRAELAMIVDLLRNDLGKVSTFGSVQVRDSRVLEQHPTVWHTAAVVESELRAGVGIAELLGAVCPGGSITGARKIRAMQIIEELEGAGADGFRRALYCGNIGAIGAGGDTLMLNIAIRTILFQDGNAHVYAGGGIVADSDPSAEYDETLHKAAALFRALGAEDQLPAPQAN